MKITIGNELHGELVTRDMTAKEVADWQKAQDEAQTQTDAKTAKDAAREAVLDKLGLTADEAQTLFG